MLIVRLISITMMHMATFGYIAKFVDRGGAVGQLPLSGSRMLVLEITLIVCSSAKS